MTKKKKHSIKVAKNSNHSACARPISDPAPCDPSLCSESSNDNTYKTSLCTAIKSIQKASSGTGGFSSKITELNTDVSKLTDGVKKEALQLLVNVFSDFLTLYTDCSANVTFLNKDFCTTINWGGCNPSNVLGRSNLNDLLNQGSSKVTGFSTWDKLYEPNMKTMLFSNGSGSGKSFAQALTDLGTTGSPAANPFLAADLQTDLSTGMSGVDPKTGAPTGAPTFNFQTNFQTIYDAISSLIPATPAPTTRWIPSNWYNDKGKDWTSSNTDGEDPRCDPGFVTHRLEKCSDFTTIIAPYKKNMCTKQPTIPPGTYPSFYNGSMSTGITNCNNDVYLDSPSCFQKRASILKNIMTNNPYLCIPDPDDSTKKLKAFISYGHGVSDGKCGSLALIRYCVCGYKQCTDNPSNIRYLINFQTGVRSVSFETSGYSYLDKSPPNIDHTTKCTLFDIHEMQWEDVCQYFPEGWNQYLPK